MSCPPWFAPQFPMVSSTNVDAVAANNVALQHYGQKVVYGHVMTDDKVSHIRSTQERLCDDSIETRLKQKREVTEQREEETKRGKREVKKCEIK